MKEYLKAKTHMILQSPNIGKEIIIKTGTSTLGPAFPPNSKLSYLQLLSSFSSP